MEQLRFLQSWRWFGPADPITLDAIRKTSAKGIVTALHHIPNGEIWEIDEIQKRLSLLQKYGFTWSVVESLPVHEQIKYNGPNCKPIIQCYKQSLANLGKCGVTKVCYNFMPVIDWVRTDLAYPWKNHGISMLFDYPTFVAFDVFILQRPNAAQGYPDHLLSRAEKLYSMMDEAQKESLAQNIIVVTQGFIDGGVGDALDYKKEFLRRLELYCEVDTNMLRENLLHFLNEIIPVAEEFGMQMCLHPDDPPYPVLGLPRIAGTQEDFQWIMDQQPSPANGITFCSGSLSSRADNDLITFLKKLGSRVHFAHLRNTTILDETGSFCESGHLEGGADMVQIIKLLHAEMARRQKYGDQNHQIPLRPDHGLKLQKDLKIHANPGYP
ncbi:UNVERIFIED_CONTAM: hypothetical protein GTU68_039780, partial [Idotea baltica]|nr:hypothetical protein [Idotea baltica]